MDNSYLHNFLNRRKIYDMDKKLINRNLKSPRKAEPSTARPLCEVIFVYDKKLARTWEEYILLEYSWKKSLPSFDTRWLIETFPEAKELIKKNLEAEIELCERQIAEANRLEKEYEDIIYRKASKKSEDFWRDVVRVCFLDPLRVKQTATIKKNTLFLSMLRGKSKTKNPIGVTPVEIARAKEYPIVELYQFNRSGAARCPFHSEKTASFCYNKKNNTARCFGACQATFDSIELYRRLNNCSFVEAVRNLSKWNSKI